MSYHVYPKKGGSGGPAITELTGDVTAVGPGSVPATIANDAVTYAKMQNMSGHSVLGRATGSTGDIAEITAGSNNVLLGRASGNVEFTQLTNGMVPTNTIGYDKLVNGSALSVLGRSANSAGANASITAGTDHHVLRRSGTTLGFGLLTNNNIDASAAIAVSKLAAGLNTQVLTTVAGVPTWAAPAGGGGTWGTITGTLSDQTDLQAALDAKQATGNYITGLTGDVTATGPGSVSATIANDAITTAKILNNNVTYAKLAQGAGTTVLGRAANTTGDLALINASANDTFLRRVSDALSFGQLTNGMVPVNTVGYDKLTNGTALSVLGRSANSTGELALISAGTDGHVLRRSGTTLGFGLLVNANIDNAAAIAVSKLAAGTNGHVLTTVSGVPTWTAPGGGGSFDYEFVYDTSGATAPATDVFDAAVLNVPAGNWIILWGGEAEWYGSRTAIQTAYENQSARIECFLTDSINDIYEFNTVGLPLSYFENVGASQKDYAFRGSFSTAADLVAWPGGNLKVRLQGFTQLGGTLSDTVLTSKIYILAIKV